MREGKKKREREREKSWPGLARVLADRVARMIRGLGSLAGGGKAGLVPYLCSA